MSAAHSPLCGRLYTGSEGFPASTVLLRCRQAWCGPPARTALPSGSLSSRSAAVNKGHVTRSVSCSFWTTCVFYHENKESFREVAIHHVRQASVSVFLLLPLDEQTTVNIVGIFETHRGGSRKKKMKGSIFLVGTGRYLQCYFIIKCWYLKKNTEVKMCNSLKWTLFFNFWSRQWELH